MQDQVARIEEMLDQLRMDDEISYIAYCILTDMVAALEE